MIQDQIRSLATTPNPIDPENLPLPQVYILHNALTVIEKYWRIEQGVPYPPVNPEPYEIPPDIEEQLDESIGVLPLKYFKICVEAFLTNIKKYPAKKTDLLDGLALALRPVKYLDRFKFKKISCDVGPGRTIEDDRISKPSPIGEGIPILEDLKHLSTRAQVKHYVFVRKSTTYDFILEQSGSISFARVHEFAKHHGDFKRSRPGKIVYDAGFAWIARKLRISRFTVIRAFKWLAKHKLVTKLGPADPRIHRNSVWYVCSSMKQNLKLWSLLGAP
jgi:hypothetical protein